MPARAAAAGRRRRAGGAGGQGGRGGGGAAADRANWDAPYIISPHSPRRLYWATNYLYRTDDRGRQLDAHQPGPVAQPESRRAADHGQGVAGRLDRAQRVDDAAQNIVSIDESPLLEGLLYVGTDDGLVQITEDGGKNWRKVEDFPGVPSGPTSPTSSRRRANADTVFVALNNWQRGDYKPYVVKSTDRGRTWTNITGNLPAKHDVWAIVQDHVNGDLLFAGTEFGLFFTVDGGKQWVQLKGGMPPAQVRDMTCSSARATSSWARSAAASAILDDYSRAARRSRRRRSPKRRGCSRCATRCCFNTRRHRWPRPAAPACCRCRATGAPPNPPFGAVFTYHVRQDLPADTRLVLTIADDTGKQVRRLDLEKTAGLRRIAWNLRTDPPAAPAAGTAGRGAGGGRGGFGGGRGNLAPLVEPGQYRATLGSLAGETVTPIGPAQSFAVVDGK